MPAMTGLAADSKSAGPRFESLCGGNFKSSCPHYVRNRIVPWRVIGRRLAHDPSRLSREEGHSRLERQNDQERPWPSFTMVDLIDDSSIQQSQAAPPNRTVERENHHLWSRVSSRDAAGTRSRTPLDLLQPTPDASRNSNPSASAVILVFSGDSSSPVSFRGRYTARLFQAIRLSNASMLSPVSGLIS
jgi:hypothetical protein